MMASPRPSEPLPPVTEEAPKPVTAPVSSDKHAKLETSNFVVGFDWVLSLGVMALAFLVVSFSVRNADFWQHLAAGRLLAEGGYTFGTDPFGQEAGRTWVNHAWLFDLIVFTAYKSLGGPGLVVLKSLLVMATSGLLLAARRHELRPELIDLRNSGDTAGDKSRVVGYAAFAFTEPDAGMRSMPGSAQDGSPPFDGTARNARGAQ